MFRGACWHSKLGDVCMYVCMYVCICICNIDVCRMQIMCACRILQFQLRGQQFMSTLNPKP